AARAGRTTRAQPHTDESPGTLTRRPGQPSADTGTGPASGPPRATLRGRRASRRTPPPGGAGCLPAPPAHVPQHAPRGADRRTTGRKVPAIGAPRRPIAVLSHPLGSAYFCPF